MAHPQNTQKLNQKRATFERKKGACSVGVEQKTTWIATMNILKKSFFCFATVMATAVTLENVGANKDDANGEEAAGTGHVAKAAAGASDKKAILQRLQQGGAVNMLPDTPHNFSAQGTETVVATGNAAQAARSKTRKSATDNPTGQAEAAPQTLQAQLMQMMKSGKGTRAGLRTVKTPAKAQQTPEGQSELDKKLAHMRQLNGEGGNT